MLYSDLLEIRQGQRVRHHPAIAPGFFVPAEAATGGGNEPVAGFARTNQSKTLAESKGFPGIPCYLDNAFPVFFWYFNVIAREVLYFSCCLQDAAFGVRRQVRHGSEGQFS